MSESSVIVNYLKWLRKCIESDPGRQWPWGIDLAPDDSFVATAAISDNKISIIDPVNLTTQHIVVGQGPHGIRTSKDSQWIYVTLTKDNQVVVINAQIMTIEK